MAKHQVNEVVVEGNLVEDPKTREFTAKGTGEVVTAASLRLANNRVKGGEDYANFINVEVVGRSAEFAGKYLRRGDEVIVTGQLWQDRWEDDQGNKRSMLLVKGREVNGRRKAGGGEAAPTQQQHEEVPSEDDIPF